MSLLKDVGKNSKMKATGKKYTSVRDMVRQTASEDEKEFVQAFEERVAKREIIRTLMAIRASKGLSQNDIAAAIGRSQSMVSKLESGLDDDLRLGEFAAYLEALGYTARIVVTKPTNSIADEIKYHWHCLGKLLDRLLDFAHRDADIAVGIGKFANEVGFNYMSRIFGFMKRLPLIAQGEDPGNHDASRDNRRCLRRRPGCHG